MWNAVRWLPAVLVVGLLVLPAAASAQEVFELSELSEAPALKSAQQAQRAITRSYPAALQSSGIGGTVQVRFVVLPDGSVDKASVEIIASSSTILGEAAQKAVSDIEFVPGKKDGTAVAAYVVMPIRYAVQ